MKQKITILDILRRSIVVICAVFCFAVFFACSHDTSALPTLSDIYAADVSVEYDGRYHSVFVVNTLPTDTVVYSTDNVSYSSYSPSFIDVGSYTVYFKVFRDGYAEFSSSASVSISATVLSDIYASDVSFVYDGLAHSIVISGALPSDIISYSTDGTSFSSDVPSFIDAGVYTVYYRVSRPYGEYRSSCTLTIFPNIYGRYFNSDHGVIVISENVSFTVSGSGYIDGIPFAVTDEILYYNSIEYSLLSDEDYIYRLTVSDKSLYFRSASSGSLSVSCKDNVAEIKLGDDLLLSVPDFNFCESGVIADYNTLCFTQAFYASSDITHISIELSVRSVNPITVDTLYFTYDGLPHTLDFSEDVVFLDDEHSFTDVGSYTVSVIFASTAYLPKQLDCTIVILPDVDGVFLSSQHVIRISDKCFFFDGMLCGELSILDCSWAFNDLPITVSDGGIEYADDYYASVDYPVLAVYVDDVYCSCLLISSDMLQLHIDYDGSVLTFSDDKNNLLLTIPLSCVTLSLSLDGIPLTPLNDALSFTLGRSDLSSPILIVRVLPD